MATYNLSAFAGAGWQFFDNNGFPLNGGKLYTYVAGTTTPKATYTDSSGGTPNANPIILNSAGRTANEVWLEVGTSYKFILQTSAGVEIATYDDIPSINDPFSLNSLLSSVTGTNAIAALATPTITTYATGAVYSFVAANTNTGATTIAIDGLTAKNIYKNGSVALTAGDIQAGKVMLIQYDGTRFQLLNNIVYGGGVTNATISGGTIASLSSPLGVASGGTGAATLTANNVLLGNGTSSVQFVAPGTSGNVLTSNGTSWASTAIPTQFPSQTGKAGQVLTTNGTTVSWSQQGIVRAMGAFNTGGTLETGSINIASVTNSGTGTYDVVFTNALASANLIVMVTPTAWTGTSDNIAAVTARSTTGLTVQTRRGATGALVNTACNFVVFGGW